MLISNADLKSCIALANAVVSQSAADYASALGTIKSASPGTTAYTAAITDAIDIESWWASEDYMVLTTLDGMTIRNKIRRMEGIPLGLELEELKAEAGGRMAEARGRMGSKLPKAAERNDGHGRKGSTRRFNEYW